VKVTVSYLEALGLLDLLKRLAEAIVAVVGPHCEVVVHDFSDPEHSVVVVAGNLSGRSPGAPIPDLSFISNELNAETPDQLNYRIQIENRMFQSSTVWVRDAQGNPIGAVCINMDYSALQKARELLDSVLESTLSVNDLVINDTFAKNLDNLIELSARDFLRQRGLQSFSALSYEEKIQLIEYLEGRGLFQIRGASQRVADLLDVSRASVYNYRANLKASKPIVENSI
jgi:predicted transcriptional regulator YheO